MAQNYQSQFGKCSLSSPCRHSKWYEKSGFCQKAVLGFVFLPKSGMKFGPPARQIWFLGCFGGLQGIFSRKFCLPCSACRNLVRVGLFPSLTGSHARPSFFLARKSAPLVPLPARYLSPCRPMFRTSKHSRPLKIPVGKLENFFGVFAERLLRCVKLIRAFLQ